MKVLVRAVLAAALLGSTALAIPRAAQAADEQKVTPAVGKALNDAIKAAKAGDFKTALDSIKVAQAVDGRTPFDDYKINSVLSFVAINQKDYATATTATEAAADSPVIPDSEKQETVHNALILASAAKQNDKVIAYGQELQAMNAMDTTVEAAVAEAYYYSKDFVHAKQYAQMSIDAAKAAGKAPNEAALQIVMGSDAQTNNTAGAVQTLENLAVDYNHPDSWNKLVENALSGKAVRDVDALLLLRLLFIIPDAMATEDYQTLASVADQQGYPTEALNVINKGVAAGKLSVSQVSQTYAHAKSGAAIDQRALPQIASSAARSKNGEQDIKLAEDYWGYARYADAEAAASRAIQKGGLKDPGEGPLLLGMLQVAQGKYQDGIQTLSQVNGSASRTSAAHLWSLYAQAQLKSQGGTSSAPASPTH